ncbi:hypothetical protein ACLOJK_008760 [Asimina triloba]
MRFFFTKLKGSSEAVSKWGVSTEWREKLADILEASSTEAAPTLLPTRVLRAEPLEIEKLAKVCAKTEEEVVKEQVLEESKKAFQEEQETREVDELQIRVVKALSPEEARRARIEVSPVKVLEDSQGEGSTKDLKTMLVVVKDERMLEAAKATMVGSPKVVVRKTRVIPSMESDTWSSKKASRAHEREQLREHLLDSWRELRDLEERMRQIDGGLRGQSIVIMCSGRGLGPKLGVVM